MSDYSFLPHFITEDVYIIKEEAHLFANEAAPQENAEVTTVTEPAAAPTTSVVAEVITEPVEQAKPQPPAKPATPEITPPTPVVQEPEPVYLKPLPTEGNNLKHCLLLVESDQMVLEPELKALLAKIMGAVKRSMDDVLLVNVKAATTEQIEALLSEQNHRHLIAFGTSKVNELNEATLYQMKVVSRKVYLRADALSEINADVAKKKALWGALKGMF